MLTHSPTLTPSLLHPFTPSPLHPFTPSLLHSLAHPLTRSPTLIRFANTPQSAKASLEEERRKQRVITANSEEQEWRHKEQLKEVREAHKTDKAHLSLQLQATVADLAALQAEKVCHPFAIHCQVVHASTP